MVSASDQYSEDQHDTDIKRMDFDLEKGHRRVDVVRPAPEIEIEMMDDQAATSTAMAAPISNVRRSAVIRVEIHDTGTGLRNSDLMRWVPCVEIMVGGKRLHANRMILDF
jgi:hypothetical protein